MWWYGGGWMATMVGAKMAMVRDGAAGDEDGGGGGGDWRDRSSGGWCW